MAYRYEELSNAPSGAGLEQNVWHKLLVTPTSIGPILDLAGFITWDENPDLNIQIAGYAALVWTDNGRWGGTPLIGESRPILTQSEGTAQGFHMFQDSAVDVYRDSSGYLPDKVGILYYIKPYLPAMQWRFFGAVP
mgnify:CR=1 FL=1